MWNVILINSNKSHQGFVLILRPATYKHSVLDKDGPEVGLPRPDCPRGACANLAYIDAGWASHRLFFALVRDTSGSVDTRGN